MDSLSIFLSRLDELYAAGRHDEIEDFCTARYPDIEYAAAAMIPSLSQPLTNWEHITAALAVMRNPLRHLKKLAMISSVTVRKTPRTMQLIA